MSVHGEHSTEVTLSVSLFQSLDGHSHVMCGPLVASCLSCTWASHSSKPMTTESTLPWWSAFLDPSLTGQSSQTNINWTVVSLMYYKKTVMCILKLFRLNQKWNSFIILQLFITDMGSTFTMASSTGMRRAQPEDTFGRTASHSG